MESIETALNEGLEPSKSPESQMAAHQVRKTEDQMKQDDRTKARSHKNSLAIQARGQGYPLEYQLLLCLKLISYLEVSSFPWHVTFNVALLFTTSANQFTIETRN